MNLKNLKNTEQKKEWTQKQKFRDSELSTKDGIVDLHLNSGTFCIAYVRENYFDSYGCPSSKKLIEFF